MSKSCVSYKDGLDLISRRRYKEKLSLIGGLDPYEEKEGWPNKEDTFPAITYPDICFYLIYTPSAYTQEDLKAWKSLDAVNQLCCGWVKDKKALVKGDHVVTAKVMHSQRMREKPLNPWVIAKPDGVVVGAHCDCMAGLGEACTHVAALLFSVSSTIQIRDSKTVTEKPAYWMLPTAMKSVQYKEVSDINFKSTRTAKKELESKLDAACSGQVLQTQTSASKVTVPEATEEEFLQFCEQLNKSSNKPVLLATVEPYADQYIPKTLTRDFPQDLTALRDTKWLDKDYDSLVRYCKTVKIQCSEDQAKNAEFETREQSESALWYRFRAGRITASNVKAVCKNSNEPSTSLVKRICYPDVDRRKARDIPALKWGRENEKNASLVLLETLQLEHENASISDSGLVISKELPFLGASPDGIWSCDCCGTACVEIKCPFKLHTSKELISEKSCDFLQLCDGELKLKRNIYLFYLFGFYGTATHNRSYSADV